MKIIERLKRWYKNLPEGKKYIELVTAALSIPVLLTVLVTNVSNLNTKKTPEQQPAQSVIVTIPTENKEDDNSNEQKEACVKEVGPVSIVYPEEGAVIDQDPIAIDIVYRQGDYCAVVWSYRINNGPWSEYTDKSIYLYNLPSGNKKLEVRVRSIASSDQVFLERNFTYTGAGSVAPTTAADQSSSDSAR